MKFNAHFIWGFLLGLLSSFLGLVLCWAYVNTLIYFDKKVNASVDFLSFLSQLKGGGGNYRLLFISIAVGLAAIPFFYCIRKAYYNTGKGILFFAILGVIIALLAF